LSAPVRADDEMEIARFLGKPELLLDNGPTFHFATTATRSPAATDILDRGWGGFARS
jgi:hypothetical protein